MDSIADEELQLAWGRGFLEMTYYCYQWTTRPAAVTPMNIPSWWLTIDAASQPWLNARGYSGDARVSAFSLGMAAALPNPDMEPCRVPEHRVSEMLKQFSADFAAELGVEPKASGETEPDPCTDFEAEIQDLATTVQQALSTGEIGAVK